MTNEQIIAAAHNMGIKPTAAVVGSEMWQCWADRVRYASALHVAMRRSQERISATIDEANRYAVTPRKAGTQ